MIILERRGKLLGILPQIKNKMLLETTPPKDDKYEFLVYREWEGGWAEDVLTDEVIENNLGWLTNVIKNPLAPKMLLFVPDARSMTTPGCVSSCWTTT